MTDGQYPRQRKLIETELTTTQLDRAFRHNIWTRRMYSGTFPVDLLPRFRPTKTPCFIIVNLDPSNKPGSHWVLIFFPIKTSVSRGCTFLFDSLGASAETQDVLAPFFKSSYRFNRLKLQDNQSKSCGYFVLAAGLLLSRGVAPDRLTSYFSRADTGLNDEILRQLVGKEFELT